MGEKTFAKRHRRVMTLVTNAIFLTFKNADGVGVFCSSFCNIKFGFSFGGSLKIA